MNNWFKRLIGKFEKRESPPLPTTATKPSRQKTLVPRAPTTGHDFIGRNYEVYDTLGKGGFGIVYLVYSHETGDVYALKTFQDWLIGSEKLQARFKREAGIWVELGHHPYLVRAEFVEKVAGRLYIALEYVAPNDAGLNTLQQYLVEDPPDLGQALHWAIQIAHGLEFAFFRGLQAHRDLKPSNIMITQDRVAKVTDFGLAGWESDDWSLTILGQKTSFSEFNPTTLTTVGRGFGTPTHMAPEQFEDAGRCDERSDIYSFGVVLYQMLTGGKLPFLPAWNPDFIRALQRMHEKARVPVVQSPLFPLIHRCLEKSPRNRPQSFAEVRVALETLLETLTGESLSPVPIHEAEAIEWIYKGISLYHLDRSEEAIRCYDQGLELDPLSSIAWLNKGNALYALGRLEEAVTAYDSALVLDANHIYALRGKGLALARLERAEEALDIYEKTLALDPYDALVWTEKARVLFSQGSVRTSLECVERAITSSTGYADAYRLKGDICIWARKLGAAEACFTRVVELDRKDATSWYKLGWVLMQGGYYEKRCKKALECFEKSIALEENNADAWALKGRCLDELDLTARAERNPRGVRGSDPLYGKSSIECYSTALRIDPLNARALECMADILLEKDQKDDAIAVYTEPLKLAPNNMEIMADKAWILMRADRLDDAQKLADEVLQQDPTRHKALWTLAEVVRRSEPADPASGWRRFLAVLMTSPDENKQLIEWAEIMIRQSQPKK